MNAEYKAFYVLFASEIKPHFQIISSYKVLVLHTYRSIDLGANMD